MKVGPIGVGRLGTATGGILGGPRFGPDDAPDANAFDEDSSVSGPDTILLRLEEEKFFRKVPELVVGLAKRPGDSGIETMLSSLPADVTRVSAGVREIVFGVLSAGLGPGNGDNSLGVPA